jgi:hypothetical protein
MQEVIVDASDLKAYALAKEPDCLEILSYYPNSLTNSRVKLQRYPDRSVQFWVWNGVAYEVHPASFVSGLFEKRVRERQTGLALASSSYNYTLTSTSQVYVDTRGKFEDQTEATIAEYIRNHFLPDHKFVLPYKDSINTVFNSLESPITQVLWKDCINITNSDVHTVKKGIVELGKLTSFKDAIEKAFGSSGPKLTKLVASRLYELSNDNYTQAISAMNIVGGNAVFNPNMVIDNITPQVTGFSTVSDYYQASSPLYQVERLSLKVFNFGFLLKDLIPLDYIHEVVEKAPLIDLTENFKGFNGFTEVEPGMTEQIRKFLAKFSPFKIKKIMLTAYQEGYLMDTTRQYLEHENDIVLPEDFKTLGELHDYVSRQYRKFKTEKKVFTLNPEWLAADNHQIEDGLVLSFPKDTWELYDWGQEFNNCVASYGERMLNGELVIVGIRNNEGKLKYCIDVRNNNIVEFRSHNNQAADKEDEVKVREFLKTLNIKTQPNDGSLIVNVGGGNGLALNNGLYVNYDGVLTYTDPNGNQVPLTIRNGAIEVAQGAANTIQVVPVTPPEVLEVPPPVNGIYTIPGADGNEINVLPNL